MSHKQLENTVSCANYWTPLLQHKFDDSCKACITFFPCYSHTFIHFLFTLYPLLLLLLVLMWIQCITNLTSC